MKVADAANTFEAVLYKFAVYAFSRHDTMTRDELWREFIDEHDFGYGESAGQPAWAKETDTAVTRQQLKSWVRGKGRLVEDLKRLGLVDKPEHGRANNYYRTDAARARRLAAQYLGDHLDDGGGDVEE